VPILPHHLQCQPYLNTVSWAPPGWSISSSSSTSPSAAAPAPIMIQQEWLHPLLCYLYTVMPKKDECAWVVIFSPTEFDLSHVKLQLWQDYSPKIDLNSISDLSWLVSGRDRYGQHWWQHNVCFKAPNDTFSRHVFGSVFQVLTPAGEALSFLLGGMLIVSNSSQCTAKKYRTINEFFTHPQHIQLVTNYQKHNPH